MKMTKRLFFALIVMGFTSLAVQAIVIREFLVVFYGNELTIGLILANWIALGALGSWLATIIVSKIRRPALLYTILQLLTVLYLPACIFIIRNLHHLLGLTFGEGVGILSIIASSFLVLAPIALFGGSRFPLACRLVSDASRQPLTSTGAVYIIEALGFIIAGPLVTLAFIANIDPFTIAFLIGLVNIVSALILLKYERPEILNRIIRLAMLLIFIAIANCLFGPARELQKLSLNSQWRGQEVLRYQNSPYGNLTVTKAGKQQTFYSDGIPVIVTPAPNVTFVEELTHFTMACVEKPKKVLLISGGPGGMLRELAKYPLSDITYVELDPLLIQMVRDFPTSLTSQELKLSNLKIVYGDGRRFIQTAQGPYDAVIVNLPMPSTLQLNRFYTEEFFRRVGSILADDGVFAITLPCSLSYLTPEIRNLNGSVSKSLSDVFHVMIIPGDYAIYLAAKKPENIDRRRFLKRLEERVKPTLVLSNAYLDYRLDDQWKEWFDSSMGELRSVRKNTDLLPAATFYAVSYWNTLFSRKARGLFNVISNVNAENFFPIALFAGLALFVCHIFLRPTKRYAVGLAIGTTGFAGMSLNLILIYAYQAIYGFVFSHFAVLITAFMVGLTAGGLLANSRLARIKNAFPALIALELALIAFSALNSPLITSLNSVSSLKLSWLFYPLLAVVGFLAGCEFPLANKLYLSENRSSAESGGMLYALDLAGSYLAALTASVILVPLIGIPKMCLLLALVKTVSATILSLAYATSRPRR